MGVVAVDPGLGAAPVPVGGTKPVAPLTVDSSALGCATGTRDLGVATGYTSGKAVAIRLCAIPNIASSGDESNPSSKYYVAGASRQAIVNSRVSAAVLAMVTAARAAGLAPSATSAFRSWEHQNDLYVASGRNAARAAVPGY